MLKELQTIRDSGLLLKGASDQELEALAGLGREVALGSGNALFSQGDEAKEFFLVLSGRLALVTASEGSTPITENRQQGELVGEVEFSTRTSHGREARALSDVRLLALTQEALDRLLGSAVGVWQILNEAILRGTRFTNLSHHLDRLFGPFGVLLPHVMRDLESGIEWVTLKGGETLVKQGEDADCAYILMAGRLLVVLEGPPGEEKVVNTVLPGETIGELALLSEHKRSSTVYAIRDSELARISPKAFGLMLERSSKAAIRVARILADRLARASRGRDLSTNPISCIALIATNPAVPARALADDLVRVLGAHGGARLLTSGSVDEALGTPGISRSASGLEALRLGQWLQEQEHRHRYLVYVADDTWTAWSERCVTHADRVVVVADATQSPGVGELGGRLNRPRLRWNLLLLHPAGQDRPRNTSRWLTDPNCTQVYHLRRGQEADLARLGRLLTGRGIGLVFGGGGARGFAHLGVMQAFEELSIPIDLIAGTSIGSTMAQVPPMGYDAATTLALAEKSFSSLLDYTFPLVSLIEGRKITRAIRAVSEGWDIEDLWFPYFCISTNLTTSEPVIHTRGSLIKAVRASVAIPGVLPPVPHDGDLLIDGGVLDNVPIDVMRERNPFGTVIGVDVSPPRGPRAKSDYGLSLSGWKLLARKLTPWRKRLDAPALPATIIYATMIGSAHSRDVALKNNLADLYLAIKVRGIGLLQFDLVRQVAKIGYEETIEPLREWREKNSHLFAAAPASR